MCSPGHCSVLVRFLVVMSGHPKSIDPPVRDVTTGGGGTKKPSLATVR